MPATTHHDSNERAPWPGPDDWVYPERPPTASHAGSPPFVPPRPPTAFDGPPFAAGPAPHRSGRQSAWLVLAMVVGVIALFSTIFVVQNGRTLLGVEQTPSSSSAAGPGTFSQPRAPGQSSNGQSSTPQSWAQVAAAIDPGVVDIETRLPQGIGAGTGMVLTDSGEILTNNHVIDGATQIAVTVATTGDSYDATVVGTDPTDDIAVLQLTGASGLATIPIGDSDSVKVGDSVAAIGNAGGQGGEPAVAPGTVERAASTDHGLRSKRRQRADPHRHDPSRRQRATGGLRWAAGGRRRQGRRDRRGRFVVGLALSHRRARGVRDPDQPCGEHRQVHRGQSQRVEWFRDPTGAPWRLSGSSGRPDQPRSWCRGRRGAVEQPGQGRRSEDRET